MRTKSVLHVGQIRNGTSICTDLVQRKKTLLTLRYGNLHNVVYIYCVNFCRFDCVDNRDLLF